MGIIEERKREREREEKELKPKSKAEAKTTQRATRLPADWMPSDSDIEFCKTTRSDLQTKTVADGFRDYWLGAGKTKADWSATWRVWVRNQHGNGARAGPSRPEKFDPLAYVNRNRTEVSAHERTIIFDTTGEPV